MSGTRASVSSGLGGERPSNRRINGGGRTNHETASSGTMQLLDRLGYGLVSVPSLPNAGPGGDTEDDIRQAAQHEVGYYSGYSSRKEHKQKVDGESYPAQVNGIGFSPPPAGMICTLTSDLLSFSGR